MEIIITGHAFEYELRSVLMMFFPGEKFMKLPTRVGDNYMRSTLIKSGEKLVVTAYLRYNNSVFRSTRTVTDRVDIKLAVKQSAFTVCKKLTGINPPWGVMTGIRPSSLFEKIKRNNLQPHIVLSKDYYISDKKIKILQRISEVQRLIVPSATGVSLYISIPFCPSKCNYCSFISVWAEKFLNMLDEYVDLLCEEIKSRCAIICEKGLRIDTIYIGGGTPGVLSPEQIGRIISCIYSAYKDKASVQEFTFELGRPDTVTYEKLELLKELGVTRVCINTQTTNDEILLSVNRNHTAAQYYKAVNMAKSFDMQINTDIIAGLPGESVKSFKKTVKDITFTEIDNITIHTLAIKRASTLNEQGGYHNAFDNRIDKMLDIASVELMDRYYPYYLYKQKRSLSGSENIGYYRHSPCKYNVFMMEDVHSVIACGAGGSTKIIKGGSTMRIFNLKYPLDYIKENQKITNNTMVIAGAL